jgi:hypothetical protein
MPFAATGLFSVDPGNPQQQLVAGGQPVNVLVVNTSGNVGALSVQQIEGSAYPLSGTFPVAPNSTIVLTGVISVAAINSGTITPPSNAP